MNELRIENAKMVVNDSGVWLALRLPFDSRQPARDFCTNWKDEKSYSVVLKEQRTHRTLDQNAYYWTLCGQLSAVLRVPPNEIYREHIRDIGGNYEITPIKEGAVQKWVEIWEGKGLGFIAEDLGESKKIPGYHNIRNYYGSSTYDKRQMGRLLDLMIEDCKLQNIETLTPEQLAIMREG